MNLFFLHFKFIWVWKSCQKAIISTMRNYNRTEVFFDQQPAILLYGIFQVLTCSLNMLELEVKTCSNWQIRCFTLQLGLSYWAGRLCVASSQFEVSFIHLCTVVGVKWWHSFHNISDTRFLVVMTCVCVCVAMILKIFHHIA